MALVDWEQNNELLTYLLTCAVRSWSDWSRTCATCSTLTSGLQMHTCWPKPTSLRTTRRTTLTLALRVACPRSPWRTKHENCKCALLHHVTVSSQCPCHCIRSVSMSLYQVSVRGELTHQGRYIVLKVAPTLEWNWSSLSYKVGHSSHMWRLVQVRTWPNC